MSKFFHGMTFRCEICGKQSLEFVAEMRIVMEMKIENCRKISFLWNENQVYFFPVKIKMMDL